MSQQIPTHVDEPDVVGVEFGGRGLDLLPDTVGTVARVEQHQRVGNLAGKPWECGSGRGFGPAPGRDPPPAVTAFQAGEISSFPRAWQRVDQEPVPGHRRDPHRVTRQKGGEGGCCNGIAATTCRYQECPHRVSLSMP
ncbi:hypothetical protein GCM10009828_104520 [Actinoplanes couchii]|uniref:Uncharacterized protein n=1 Tax=Actinoplanes couchii TaxID=403638 RepID=A0ABQ3XL69_9ACTN|nr:hypothetical protein Aco03nite_076560 [Actinoplanes couchii]